MEELMEDCFDFSGIDEEYEFDAPQFYDFTQEEVGSEIEELERWFEVSGDYPPSPFIIKLNLEKVQSSEPGPSSSEAKCSNRTKSIRSSSSLNTGRSRSPSTSKRDAKGKSHPSQENAKPKSDARVFLAKGTSFMKPTASHLAKQKKVQDNNSNHICKRFRKKSAKLDLKGLQSPTRCDNPAIKRQKLEIGYLKKVAHLKHQSLSMHKLSKKVTIPKEPELETQFRALKRRSKCSCVLSENGKQKQLGCNFKALPSNKKVGKQSKIQRVHPSVIYADVNQDADDNSSTIMDCRLTTGNMLLDSPLAEPFSELSLGSDNETKSAPWLNRNATTKDFRKAAHIFQSEFWRSHTKSDQCGNHIRAHESQRWSNITRSLGVS